MKKSFTAFFIFMAGCTSGSQSSQQALSADPTARSFGVDHYTTEADSAVFYDRDGIELGRFVVSAPDVDRRLIDFAFTDGNTDEIEVYRPLDGRFVSPIQPVTVSTAVVADKALAPLFSTQAIEFKVTKVTGLDATLATEDTATTSRCVGTATDHNLATCTANCDWQSDSPVGCARPANLNAGCTNPSQLPAAVILNTLYDTGAWVNANSGPECDSTCKGWGYYGMYIWEDTGCDCADKETENQWVASCPRSTCGTVGQYDSVPRLRDCLQPGSCTKSQGAVGCTAYH